MSKLLEQPIVELDTTLVRVTERDDGVPGDVGSVDDATKEELASGTGADLFQADELRWRGREARLVRLTMAVRPPNFFCVSIPAVIFDVRYCLLCGTRGTHSRG